MNVLSFTALRWIKIAEALYEGRARLSTGSQEREAEGLGLYIQDQIAIALASGVDMIEYVTLDFGDDYESALSIRQASAGVF